MVSTATAIIVTSTPITEGAPCIPTISGLERQTGDHEVFVVINAEGMPHDTILRKVVPHVTTDLVIHVEEGTAWEYPDMLDRCVVAYDTEPSLPGRVLSLTDPEGRQWIRLLPDGEESEYPDARVIARLETAEAFRSRVGVDPQGAELAKVYLDGGEPS